MELRVIDVRTHGAARQEFHTCVKKFLDGANRHQKQDIFFGVSLRRGKDGKKAGCTRVAAVWVDIEDRTLDYAASMEPEPNIVVESGGGLHCYWLFHLPVNVADEILRILIENINRGLVKKFGGDKSATDVSRVLRVPGYWNHKDKYPEPRPVRAWLRHERRYAPVDFTDIQIVGTPSDFQGAATTADKYERTFKDERRNMLLEYAGHLVWSGKPANDTIKLTMKKAMECEPPYTEKMEFLDEVAGWVKQREEKMIFVGELLDPAVTKAEQLLRSHIYMRGETLVRVGEEEQQYRSTDAFRRPEGNSYLAILSPLGIESLLSQLKCVYRTDKKTGDRRLADPPEKWGRMMLDRVKTFRDRVPWRELTSITNVPVLLEDGSLVSTPGLPRGHRRLLRPARGEVPNHT
jgi:hypothetical protein